MTREVRQRRQASALEGTIFFPQPSTIFGIFRYDDVFVLSIIAKIGHCPQIVKQRASLQKLW